MSVKCTGNQKELVLRLSLVAKESKLSDIVIENFNRHRTIQSNHDNEFDDNIFLLQYPCMMWLPVRLPLTHFVFLSFMLSVVQSVNH